MCPTKRNGGRTRHQKSKKGGDVNVEDVLLRVMEKVEELEGRLDNLTPPEETPSPKGKKSSKEGKSSRKSSPKGRKGKSSKKSSPKGRKGKSSKKEDKPSPKVRVFSLTKGDTLEVSETVRKFIAIGDEDGEDVVVEGKLVLMRENEGTLALIESQMETFGDILPVGEVEEVNGREYVWGVKSYTVVPAESYFKLLREVVE